MNHKERMEAEVANIAWPLCESVSSCNIHNKTFAAYSMYVYFLFIQVHEHYAEILHD